MRLTIEVEEGEQIYIQRMKDKKPKKSNKNAEKFVKEFLTPPSELTEEEHQERMNTIVDGLDARFNLANQIVNKPSHLAEELDKAAMRNANNALAVRQFQEMGFRD